MRPTGRGALWGALFTSYPGWVVTLTSDLTELVAAAALLAAIAAVARGRTRGAVAASAAGALARESVALFAGAVALARLRERPLAAARWLPYAIPLVLLVGWQAVLAARWHAVPAAAYSVTLLPPFLGPLVAAWWNPTRLGALENAVWLAVVVYVLASIAIAAGTPRPAIPGARLAWLAYAAVTLSVNANFWANAGILRAATELEMLGALFVLAAPARARAVLLLMDLALMALLLVTRVPI